MSRDSGNNHGGYYLSPPLPLKTAVLTHPTVLSMRALPLSHVTYARMTRVGWWVGRRRRRADVLALNSLIDVG